MEQEKWSIEFLTSKSLKTDSKADELIKSIIDSGGQEAAKTLFSQLTSNQSIDTNPNLHPEIAKYFESEMELPSWADPKKIKIAEDLFAIYGPEIAFILNFRALPLCYSSKSGSKVLYSTGRLRKDGQNTSKMTRRLMETSQMVINVMSTNGFDPKGAGIITVKKVRLIHASIRFYLKNPHINPKGWDVSELGEPINQEEMAGTLMAFAPLSMKGLELMGIELTTEQKNAYTHCWNIVGHFIGLDKDLMPQSHDDGWDLGLKILTRNQQKSKEGVALGKSIVQFGQNIFPGYYFDDMPAYFIKRFTQDVSDIVGVDFAALIGINPKPTLKRRFVAWLTTKTFDKMDELQKKSWVFSKVSKWMNKKLLQGLINFYLKNNETEFNIPPSLRENWSLK